MDYFVSIENTPYHRWQVELLIESFKAQNMADNLLVAIANNTSPQHDVYTNNLFAHPRKFVHANVGKEAGYLPLNKLFALYTATKSGLLTQPFAVLHPDMMLLKPIEPLEVANVVMHAESFTPIEAVDLLVQTHWDAAVAFRKLELNKSPSFHVLGTMVFNCVPALFFLRTMNLAKDLLKFHPTVADHEASTAMNISLCDYVGLLVYRTAIMDRSLQSNSPANLLHYRSGSLPSFHKRHFLHESVAFSINMTASNPYEALLKLQASPSYPTIETTATHCQKHMKT